MKDKMEKKMKKKDRQVEFASYLMHPSALLPIAMGGVKRLKSDKSLGGKFA